MRIEIILPNQSILNQEAQKITAPGSEGFFQILPRHVDFVSSLVPGILSIFNESSVLYYAIDRGFLVKKADMVYIACLQAIVGSDLESLSQTIADNFRELDEKEKKINTVLRKLEADTLRRFLEMD